MTEVNEQPRHVTIARVKQVSKWLEVWTTDADPEGRWDICFRNGWKEHVVWDDNHYDELLSYGLSGIVVDFHPGENRPRHILGRRDVWERIGEAPHVNSVRFTESYIEIRIAGAKVWVRAPLSSRLREATPAQREDFEYINVIGIRWPELDEDLSVAGIIRDAVRWWSSDTDHLRAAADGDDYE